MTQATGLKFLTCQVRPVLDSDVVDGKVVSRQRYVGHLSETGMTVIDLVGDTPAEVFRKMALWMEAEGYTF